MSPQEPRSGPERLYLTIAEACEALGVSRGTLERGVRRPTAKKRASVVMDVLLTKKEDVG